MAPTITPLTETSSGEDAGVGRGALLRLLRLRSAVLLLGRAGARTHFIKHIYRAVLTTKVILQRKNLCVAE